MKQTEKLFTDPETTVEVDGDRDEPRVWVRRLVIRSKPGEVIREVQLRRGLNIVWSPDPGEEAAEVGRGDRGIGHGAGKTLFCRFVRYCLGEETFATDEQREAVGVAFPEGYVGAEVVVNGQQWGVLRPLGTTRRHYAVQGKRPEELFDFEGKAPGIAPLLQAITEDVLPAGIDDGLPGTKEWKSWLLGLAWMTRDQECRFGHLLEWRHPQADTRSTVPGISKEQLAIVVRTFLAAMAAEERKIRARIERLETDRKRLEADAKFQDRFLDRTGRLLVQATGMDESLLTAKELAAQGFIEEAEKRLKKVEDAGNDSEVDTELPELRTKLESPLQQLAVVKSQHEQALGLITVQEQQIKVIRGERANLDAEELKAMMGDVCPVCSVPIDRALAEGCGLSHKLHDPVAIERDKKQKEQEITACEGAIATYRSQIQEKESVAQGLEREIAKLRSAITAREKKLHDARRRRRKTWYQARRLVDDARRFSEAHVERAKIAAELEKTQEQEARLKEKRAALQSEQRDVMARFRELFDWVCKGVLGATVEGSIELSAKGIEARVENVGNGVALDSVKAVAFDLAALLMSIEGRSGLPAFLIHDSPREADLGISIYHRLFNFAAKLEGLGSEAPFQYILTTTTMPPKDLSSADQTVLVVGGKDFREQLLGVTF